MIGFSTDCEAFIGLNDWPSKLSARVMESRGLAWTPTERTNFVQHVAATRVKIEFLEFEMGKGFRFAVLALFAGWWLYITELKAFHEFEGFPFDRTCKRLAEA